MRIIVSITFICLILSGCNERNQTDSSEISQENVLTETTGIQKMNLTVLSDYGSVIKSIADSATVDHITSAMDSIDWNVFHQVVLTRLNNDYLEVGGSLSSDGLSVLYRENGRDYVIVSPPAGVQELKEILLSYLAGDGKFKTTYTFE